MKKPLVDPTRLASLFWLPNAPNRQIVNLQARKREGRAGAPYTDASNKESACAQASTLRLQRIAQVGGRAKGGEGGCDRKLFLLGGAPGFLLLEFFSRNS